MEKFLVFTLFLIIFQNLVSIESLDTNDINLDSLKSQIPETVNITKIQKALEDKCTEVSGNDTAYKTVQNGSFELMECVQDIINITKIQKEIEDIIPTGELDTVFHKYCDQRWNILNCTKKFMGNLELCLTKDELKHKDSFMNIFSSILEFVCYKGGDQIALFIAEDGPKCFNVSQPRIEECARKALNRTNIKFDSSANIVSQIPNFIIGEKECSEMDNLQQCVVRVLEDCDNITPANIVDSMFRYVYKETGCQQFRSASLTSTGGGRSKGSKLFYSSTIIPLISLIPFLLR